MPITLAESRNLTQDKLAQVIIDEFRKDPLLGSMIFDNTVTGGGGQTLAYVYNRVTTLATAGFRALNTEYVAQEAKTTLITAILKVFGGSYQVDRVIQKHVKGITDQISFQQGQKIQATKAVFSDAFINGDSGTDAASFDGLDKAIAGSSTEFVPTDVIDLSSASALDDNYKAFLDALDKWLATLDGKPTGLYINRVLSALFAGIARRTATFTETRDEFGNPVLQYQQIPLVSLGDKAGSSTPIIGIGAGADAGLTSIYAARIGMDGVHAVSPAGDEVISYYLPDMKAPGAVKTGEVEMVAAVILKATRAAGAFRKVKVA